MSSKTVDDKVVEMRFDNEQFERNVRTSLSTLDKLKQALRLDNAGKDFEKLERASGRVSMGGLSGAIETVQAKFSALEVIGVTALANITNSAINAGTQLARSLSIDQITAGWGKYGEKTASVQTIMNATGKSIDEVNAYLDKLMWFSDETSYGFTDMTSALGQLTSAGGDIDKLIPMITGIANATAFAGKGAAEFSRSIYNLNQSYSAGSLQYMDWRSLELAGVASEQLKKTFIETGIALGKIKEGQVTIANFGTTLKDKWADTSVMEAAFGKFGEMTEKAYEMVQSGAVETASEAYAILSEQYDGVSIKAAKAAQEAKTFAEAIDATKDAVSSGWMKSFELIFGNYEEAKVLWTDLANSLWDVFASGGESRNEMLTEALTSGWSRFLKEGIPDAVAFKEAIVDTALHYDVALCEIVKSSTDFEDSLKQGWLTSDVLAGSLAALTQKTAGLSDEELANLGYTRDQINALEKLNRSVQDGTVDLDEYVKQIGRLSGRENLVEAFWNTWNAFFTDTEEQAGVLTVLKQAFQDIFPATTSEQLYAFTEALRELTEKFKMSEETADKLGRSFKGLFAILDIIGSFVKAVVQTGFDLLSSALGKANFHILDMTSSAGDAIVAFRDWLKENDIFAGALGAMADGLKLAAGLINEWIERFMSLPQVQSRIKKLQNTFSAAMGELARYFSGGMERISEFLRRVKSLDSISLNNLGDILRDFKDNVLGYFITLGGRFNSFGSVLNAFKGKVLECLTGVKGGFNNLGDAIQAMKEHIAGYFTGLASNLDGWLKKIFDFIAALRGKFSDNIGLGEILTIGIGAGLIVTVKKIGDALETLAGPFEGFASITKNVGKLLSSCSKAVNAFALKTKSEALINIAGAIAILVGSIALLTFLDQTKLWSAIGMLGVLAAGLVGISAVMGVLEKLGNVKKISISIKGLATGLLILVAALKKMDDLDGSKVWGNLGIMGLMTAGLTAATVVMSKAAPELTKGALFILSFATSLRVLVGAMKEMEKLDISKSAGSIPLLAAMVAGLVLVAKAGGSLNAGSAAGILAVAVSLGIMAGTFQKIVSLDLSGASHSIEAFVAIFGSFAAVTAASKLAGANAAKAGVGILAMSAALLLLVPAIKGIGKLDPLDMERASETIAKLLLVFAAVTAASKLAGENAAKAGVMLLMMSGALVILSGVMVLLSHLEPEGLKRALIAITALEVVFGALIAVTHFANDVKSTLTLLAVSIGLLATALGALSLINPGNLLAASASLSLIMGAFSLVVASTKLAEDVNSTIVAMTLAVGALAGILALLSGLDMQNSLISATALSELLVALSTAMVIAGKADEMSKTALASLGVMVLVVGALAGILGLMAYLDVAPSLETAASLSLLLVSLSGACLILSKVGAAGSAAFVGVGALAVLIAAVGGIMGTLGALNYYFPQMEEFLNTGLVLLEKIGYGLGAFSGNIIGGFLAGTTSGLPEIGENLSAFMTNAKPFFDNVKGIDASAMTGVEALAKAIVFLSSADILNSLTSWLTGGASLTTFGEQLSSFGSAFREYANEVNGIENMDVVAASANAAKTLAEFASAIPNMGGILADLVGENSMSAFAEELKNFGPAFSSYASSVSGVDMDTVTASAAAAKSLAEFASAIPNSGGWLETVMGENSIGDFGNELKAFGPAFSEYAKAVAGIDMDTVTASAAAAKSLAVFASAIPNSGGWLETVMGENSIGDFGNELKAFGPAFSEYAGAVAGIDMDTVTASAAAAKSLAVLAKELPNSGGLAGFFAGNNNIDKFGEQLAAFGESFKMFYGNISEIGDVEKVNAAAVGLQALVNVAKGAAGNGTGLKNFGNFLKELAETKLDDFLNAFKNAESDIRKAGESLGKNLETGVRNTISGLKKAGQDAAQGFVNGIKSKMSAVSSAGSSLGKTAEQSARKALDSHSPSKVFKDIGEDVSAGLGLGISNNAGAVKNAVSSVVDTAKAGIGDLTGADLDKWIGKVTTAKDTETQAAQETAKAVEKSSTAKTESAKKTSKAQAEAVKSSFEEFEEYIEEERYYNRITTQEQLDQYKEVLETYQLTAEERKKVSREIYTLENQLRKESYQASLDWIEEEKYYNRLSTQEELEAYEGMQKRYIEGSEERKKIDREIYALRNQLMEESYQHSMDWIENEKYYNRLSLEEELAAYERVQARYAEGSEEYKKMDREIYRVRNELVDASYQHSMDWIENEKYYNRLSLEEELAAYERVKARYAAGSEEYKKMDREIYRVRNELVAESYQASLDWIEDEKYYNRLSLEEELAAYECMQEEYIEGSEERKKIDREVYRLRNELMDESYQKAIDWIEEEKYYNRLSLADELAAYKRLQSQYAVGTEQRKKLDREVYSLEKEIYEAQKQYTEDIQRVQAEAAQKRLDLEEEYADKVKSINEKLERDIKSLNDQYENALKSRENSLYGSYGLFDEVKEREEVSSETLMKNLEAQVKEFGQWQDILDNLSARGLDSELIGELQQMGPSAIAQIKALNSMSDSELEKYVALWSIKHAIAREQALDELKDLRIETQNNIAQLRVDADRELEEYRAMWQQKMEQVTIDANAELDQLKKNFEEKVGIIKANTTEELTEMTETAQKILREAGWDETGKQIVEGLTGGVEEEKPNFIQALVQLVTAGIQAVKNALGIKSPSKVFNELGNFVGLGFVNGLTNYADRTYHAGVEMADAARAGLSDSIRKITDAIDNGIDAQPTIRPVLDLSDVTRGAGELNSLLNFSRSADLAWEAGVGMSGHAGRGGTDITVQSDDVVKELRSLRSDMGEMADAIGKMKLVLDTGILVGQLAGPMDSALGRRSIQRGRGI